MTIEEEEEQRLHVEHDFQIVNQKGLISLDKVELEEMYLPKALKVGAPIYIYDGTDLLDKADIGGHPFTMQELLEVIMALVE